MARQKTIFVCQQCGSESPKWMGKCPNCGEWNSLVETVVAATRFGRGSQVEAKPVQLQKLTQIKMTGKSRLKTGITEFDQVLGGGIVPGSVVLLAGEPGIGKSTLLLQIADKIGGVYLSGEESLTQIKIRAQRLEIGAKNLEFLAETNLESIIISLEQYFAQNPQSTRFVVIDSIQSLSSEGMTGIAGSLGQVRECAARLVSLAKSKEIAIFLVGHITKEGVVAGPKTLEHLVDVVLSIEGERFGTARLLRVAKNRFGATDEVGIFEMKDKGLIAVDNPSRLFLSQQRTPVPGSAVVAALEGTRIVLAEIQGLAVPTQLAIPRRIGRGVDYERLQLIVAVLTKRLGFPFGNFDIYVNVAGGLQVGEPAADLGIALAIISSFKNLPLEKKTVCFGELGLLGDLREVGQTERRKKEARRLGFTNIISPERYSNISQVARSVLGRVVS